MSAMRSRSARQRVGAKSVRPRARRRSSASTRSRISAAALRVKVIARMFAGSTPASDQAHVAIDEHARLPRPRRRLEHDVVGRLDREIARGLIGRRVRVDVGQLKQTRLLHRPPPDIPCGTRRRTGTSRTCPGGAAAAEIAGLDAVDDRWRTARRARAPRRPRFGFRDCPARPRNSSSSPNARYIAAAIGCDRPSSACSSSAWAACAYTAIWTASSLSGGRLSL